MTTVGRWNPNKVRKRILDGTWVPGEDLPSNGGLAVVFPTSVVSAGTGSSATVSNTGDVVMTSCTAISVNGCFSSNYINYTLMITGRGASFNVFGIYFRLRASGTDNTTASSYIAQYLDEHGPYRYAGRGTGNAWSNFNIGSRQENFPTGTVVHLYGPFLTQPTAFRSIDSVGHDGTSTGRLRRLDGAGTHNVSSSFDGFTLSFDDAFTGDVRIYGMAG
jgi:hypothetical protein